MFKVKILLIILAAIVTIGVIILGVEYISGDTVPNNQDKARKKVVIESKPSGASIDITKTEEGKLLKENKKTPYSTNLSPGKYLISIYKSGYATWQEEMEIKEDKEIQAELTPITELKEGAP